MSDEKSNVELSGTAPEKEPAKPAPQTENPVEKPAAEKTPETPSETPAVGTVKDPTGDAPSETQLSQSFRIAVASLIRQSSAADRVIEEAAMDHRLTPEMRDHLQREAAKFVAVEICKLTKEEMRKNQ